MKRIIFLAILIISALWVKELRAEDNLPSQGALTNQVERSLTKPQTKSIINFKQGSIALLGGEIGSDYQINFANTDYEQQGLAWESDPSSIKARLKRVIASDRYAFLDLYNVTASYHHIALDSQSAFIQDNIIFDSWYNLNAEANIVNVNQNNSNVSADILNAKVNNTNVTVDNVNAGTNNNNARANIRNSFANSAITTETKPTVLEGITLERIPVRIAQAPTTKPNPRILAPIPDTVLDTPSTAIVIQVPIGTKYQLRAGGRVVPDNQIGKTEEDSSSQIITITYFGVVLNQGENLIELYRDGETKPIATSRVVTRGGITKIELQTVETRIPADGKTTATIQGQLLDERGNRSNQTAIITLSATQGEFVGKDAKPDIEGWQVEAVEGKFTAQLRSNLTSGNVRIRAETVVNNKILEGFTQILFETNLRPSIVTGVLDLRYGPRGTDYYSSFRNFLPADRNNDYQLSLYGAIFGTGQIGEWLFTGSYNTLRTLNETCAGLPSIFGNGDDCENNYPVYGDTSNVTRLTYSYSNLFLRLERTSPVPNAGIDYFMWGDFRTEEFANPAQQFTALNRSLHGFKFNYNFGDLQLTGFYNVVGSGFQRDAIAPDGTSGFYFLSRRDLVDGSETVLLETVELQNPSNIISRQQLQRGKDYEIDYERGSLLFRNPISQTAIAGDGSLLRRQIIVSYEYRNSIDTNSYGAQARYTFNRTQGMESWLGINYFRENQGNRNFAIYGANAQVYFSRNIKLQAEYGRSESVSPDFGFVSGSAYRLELDARISETIRASAFYRSADAGFNNNATLSFTPGQTRYGAKIDAILSNDTSIRAAVEREENRGIAPTPTNSLEALLNPNTFINRGTPQDNDLTTVTVGLDQKLGSALLSLDYIYRSRVDRIGLLSSNSSQLRSRLTTPLADNLRLTLQNELTLSGTSDTVYSDRTTLGVTWQIAQGLNFTLGQQWYHTGQLAGQAITTAELAGEYRLGEDTALTGRFSVLSGGQDTVTQGAVGLRQRWVIAQGLRLNLAYERVFGTPLRLGTGVQFSQPFAVGQTANSLALLDGDNYSASLEYTPSSDFKADLRFEQRNSSSGTNTVISASAIGKITPELWILGRYQQASIANQLLGGIGSTVNLRVGLAYRPVDNDTFNALLRYEYRRNPSTIPETVLFGAGTGYEDHTFAIEAIYAPNHQWEFYGKYALRNSTTTFAGDLVGTGSVSLAQLRATYRLTEQFDITGEARFISHHNAGYSETGFVAELGYWLSPSLRLAVGYSSGAVNSDRDFSGSRSAGGLYLGATLRIDQLFDNFGVQRPLPPTPAAVTSAPPPPVQANNRISWQVAQQIGDKGANLSEKDRLVLDNLAVVLQSSSAITLDIQSPIAITEIQNKENPLTQRLIAIRSYLTQRGVNPSQILFRSVGANANDKISFVISGDTNSFRHIVSHLQAQPNSPARQFFDSLLSQLPPAPAIAQAVTPAISDPNRILQAIEITPSGKIADRSQALLDLIVSTAMQQPHTDIEIAGDQTRSLAIRRYLIDKGISGDRILFNNAETASNAVLLSLAPSAPPENIATAPPVLPTYQSLNQWQTDPVGLRFTEDIPLALLPNELLNPQNITILPNAQLIGLLIPDDVPAVIASGIDNVPVDLRLTTALNFLLNNFTDPLTALKEAIGVGGTLQGQVFEGKDLPQIAGGS
jgi:hypothetical protein